LRKFEPTEKLRRQSITSAWIADQKHGKYLMSNFVGFAAGKLHSVHKQLLSDDGDEVEFGRQLYFAMRDLELEGNSLCTIETENYEAPEFSHKTALLQCGKKSITIELQRFEKESESVQLNEELNAR